MTTSRIFVMYSSVERMNASSDKKDEKVHHHEEEDEDGDAHLGE